MKNVLILFALFSLVFPQLISQPREYDQKEIDGCVNHYAVLFDSLVNTPRAAEAISYQIDSVPACVEGRYFPIATLLDQKGVTLPLHKEKPTLMIFSATWCKPCRAEIPAINQIATVYGEQIDIIVVFWDQAESMIELSQQYDGSIILVPSPTQQRGSDFKMDGFIHRLGYPATYFLSETAEIIKVSRGAAVPKEGKRTQEEANNINFTVLEEGVRLLIDQK